MRQMPTHRITETVARLCIEANYELGDDVIAALQRAVQQEESPQGRDGRLCLLENARLAAGRTAPLCQDCGVAVVFVELGQDVHRVGGDLNDAIAEGVRQGYAQGYLRRSMVWQPFSARVNTKDNTPPVIYGDVVPGDRLRLIVAPRAAAART